MSHIIYRRANYSFVDDRKQVLRLYREIFHMDFLDKYPAEERSHHMCIHYLDSTPTEREKIGGDWLFYMGDGDLY